MMRRLQVFLLVLLVAVVGSVQATTIYDIQYVPDPGSDDASPLLGQTVTVTGLVTFEPMSSGGNSFFIADDSGPWNGVNVYTDNVDYNLGFGWEVEVTGVVDEYNGLTEILATEVTVLDNRYDMAAFWEDYYANPGNYPELQYNVVDPANLINAADAEQYEGCLVRIEDVSVETLPDDNDEWSVNDGNGNIVAIDDPADDKYGYYHKVVEGNSYERIQGILNYSYGEYKIRPEIAWDLKVVIDQDNGFYTQIAYFQQVRPMDLTVREFEGEYRTWDPSYAANSRYGLPENEGNRGEDIIIHAVVSYPTDLGYAGSTGAKFIMTDWLVGDTQEPWMSVLSYTPDLNQFGNLYEGDEVVFYGQVGEYYTEPSYMTEVWLSDPYEFLSFENPVPAPRVVDVEDLRDQMTPEMWGNVFVQLQNVVNITNDPPYGVCDVDDDLNDEYPGVNIYDDSAAMEDYVPPPVGTNLVSVTGWMYNHYGNYGADTDNWAFQICPSYPDDILVGEGPPNILSVTRDYGVVPPGAPVTINATIADNSSVERASIFYRVDNGTWESDDMDFTGDIYYEYELEPQSEGTWVEYYIEAEDDLGTISTYPSDLNLQYLGYWADDEMSIQDIQWTPWANGASPYDGVVVDQITGVITTTATNALTYDDDPDAAYPYFMQVGDDPAWSGIVVILGESTYEQGDEITVIGATVDESGEGWASKWEKGTRLINPASVTVNSSGNAFETYQTDVSTVNADLEAWEGVLVQFTDITVGSINQYDVDFRDASNEVFLVDDDMVSPYNSGATVDPGVPAAKDLYDSLQPAMTSTSFTGVVTYSFGTWKIEVRDEFDFGTLGVGEGVVEQPLSFNLAPVYPNPFNPSTTINFSVPWTGNVKVIVYNALGQKVTTLLNEQMTPGQHTLVWNAQNVSSGTYFLRLLSNREQKVQKMVLMK
ncbi:T9SS type A sorting domain-containing protein [bacterium]|nr:T9SS type A sorting domain-containing protein [bacterium]